jgi:type III pantothenate kinase
MIVIDVGNTNIVLGVYSNTKLKKIFRFNSKSLLTIKEIKKKFTKNYILKLDLDFNICIISSVVIGLDIKIKDIFEKINLKIKNISYKNLPIKIKFDIDNPHELGNDRIANSIAAINKYGKNCLVIDFGTATTFDVIQNFEYKGGVIAPGINASHDTLVQNASRLKKIKFLKTNKVVGKNTIKAMQSGFYWGYVGLINGIVKRILIERKFKPCVILTGGLANLYKKEIIIKTYHEPDLTLEGLYHIGINLNDRS